MITLRYSSGLRSCFLITDKQMCFAANHILRILVSWDLHAAWLDIAGPEELAVNLPILSSRVAIW